jgi:hypothetical protein
MTTPLSCRIQTTLTSSSLTPRSAQSYLAYLSTLQHTSNDEILYTEAKLAMGSGDTATARTLFDQCPMEYKRVKQYRKQLDTFDTLCTHGIIDRRDTLDVRVFLADIIGEETASPNVVRYADSLVRHGYNRRSLDALTMTSMELCMEHASMTDGHRCLFEASVAKRTPTLEFLFLTAVRALERCGSVIKCIKNKVPEELPKNMMSVHRLRDDDDRDTGGVDDEDETAGD